MKNIKNYIVAIFYSFRQSTKVLFKTDVMAGNLDPFYLCGPLYIIDKIKNKDKNGILKLILCMLPLCVLGLFQILINENVSILKLIINLLKISICIMSMMYIKNNWNKFDYKKIVCYSMFILFFLTLLSLIFSDNLYLWRFNDIVNKYNVTRLQLLYLEPSELGFHIIILIIFVIGYFINEKNKKQKLNSFLILLLGIFVLYFAQPFGAIVCGVVAIISMFLYKYLFIDKRSNLNKLFITVGLIFSIIVVFLIMYFTKSSILLRLLDTLNGVDASNSFRITTSFEILVNSFKEYNGLGCGFGNLNSTSFLQQNGIFSVVANSFQYFIIEGGVIAIIFLMYLIYKLFRKIFKSKSIIKIGLFVFLISYQIFGGHFTSGLTWVLYGLILSDFNDNFIIGENKQ